MERNLECFSPSEDQIIYLESLQKYPSGQSSICSEKKACNSLSCEFCDNDSE